MSPIGRCVVTYRTRFGAGWLEMAGTSLWRAGLPGSPLPAEAGAASPEARHLSASLQRYWAGEGPLPRPEGLVAGLEVTPLRAAIYRSLLDIPQGATVTYRALAESVGRRGAARAVGAAMARNPVAPLIPCHRVVGSDGYLRGYAGGIEMKRHLLDMEAGRG